MYSENDFRFYSEKHLAHSWGHTAEQKEAEREYNKWYYQNHKERWAHVNDNIKTAAQDKKISKDEAKALTRTTANAVRDEAKDYTKKSINNLKRAGRSLLKTEAQIEADKKAAAERRKRLAERGRSIISGVLSLLGKNSGSNSRTKTTTLNSNSKRTTNKRQGMTADEIRKYHLDAARRVEQAFPGSPNVAYHLSKATGGRRSRKKFYGNGGGNANRR